MLKQLRVFLLFDLQTGGFPNSIIRSSSHIDETLDEDKNNKR